jgi:hypothetical protein
MNLKRGLNRLVLALGVLWLVVGFPLAYRNVKTKRDSACIEAAPLTASLNRFATDYNDKHAEHGPWEEYGNGAVYVEGPDRRMYLFPAGSTKEDAVAYFKQSVAQDGICKTAKPIRSALLVALLPPVIGYGLFHALFATVLWIIRGFSQ